MMKGPSQNLRQDFWALSKTFSPFHCQLILQRAVSLSPLIPIFLGLRGVLTKSLGAFFSFFSSRRAVMELTEWLLVGSKVRELKSNHYLTAGEKKKNKKAIRNL